MEVLPILAQSLSLPLLLQQVLQQQRLLHAENIADLRSALQDGEPCLVCGSTSHPYKVEDTALSKALFELQQQQEQQERRNPVLRIHLQQQQLQMGRSHIW